MKHQQVVVDYWTMAKTSCLFLLLALLGYVFIKMVQTIFWLPGYLQNNQKRLEELAAQYSVDLNKENETVEDVCKDFQTILDNQIVDKNENSGEQIKKGPEIVQQEAKKEL